MAKYQSSPRTLWNPTLQKARRVGHPAVARNFCKDRVARAPSPAIQHSPCGSDTPVQPSFQPITLYPCYYCHPERRQLIRLRINSGVEGPRVCLRNSRLLGAFTPNCTSRPRSHFSPPLFCHPERSRRTPCSLALCKGVEGSSLAAAPPFAIFEGWVPRTGVAVAPSVTTEAVTSPPISITGLRRM
jgi:hypothetical protein